MRIAVYDSRIVFDSMPERAAVESEFALEQAKARTMLAEASDSLRQTLDEYTKAEARLSPREREAGSLHLRARELLVEEMMANLDALVLQRLETLRRPLLDRIRKAVRTVRTRQGVQLVIDLASEGVVIDADPSIDVTAAVLAELRKPDPAREPDVSAPERWR
ncbi:OmpH family outer membrane protein [Gemmatimonas sp.]|uniref:OmpH family outer membrane protein n=1 Tax=Gemmatimonas sp. TaxID=1962908 RepID=UPI00356A5B06